MTWEKEIDIHEVKEIRSRNTTYLGVGALKKIDDIVAAMKDLGHTKYVVVTGKGAYKRVGAWAEVEKAFAKHGASYVLYDQVTPNPTVDQIDEATKLGLDHGATAVLSIGGGSPIDAAKSVAILLHYPKETGRTLYEYKFTPTSAAPLVCINLTHGTGTEVDRFAVASILEQDFKPAIAYDCIYPLYAIDDPALMTELSEHQTRYVSIDAVNHVTEAATTKMFSSPYSVMMAAETVRLIDEHLPRVLKDPKDLEARYYLLYASAIAGIAFDNGMLHLTHGLEHPLSAVKPDLTHGQGLAILLPSVVEEIWPVKCKTLRHVLAPMFDADFPADPARGHDAALQVERWLQKMGAVEKLTDMGFSADDVPHLVDLTRETPSLGLLLDLAPVDATPELVERIYRNSLTPLNK